MKLPRIVILSAALAFAACDKTTPPVDNTPPPVVDVPPVLTVPYEDGYKLGFDKGLAAGARALKLSGKPAAKAKIPMPSEADLAALTDDAAGSDTARDEKWRHGFSGGYIEGFRAGLGQK